MPSSKHSSAPPADAGTGGKGKSKKAPGNWNAWRPAMPTPIGKESPGGTSSEAGVVASPGAAATSDLQTKAEELKKKLLGTALCVGNPEPKSTADDCMVVDLEDDTIVKAPEQKPQADAEPVSGIAAATGAAPAKAAPMKAAPASSSLAPSPVAQVADAADAAVDAEFGQKLQARQNRFAPKKTPSSASIGGDLGTSLTASSASDVGLPGSRPRPPPPVPGTVASPSSVAASVPNAVNTTGSGTVTPAKSTDGAPGKAPAIRARGSVGLVTVTSADVEPARSPPILPAPAQVPLSVAPQPPRPAAQAPAPGPARSAPAAIVAAVSGTSKSEETSTQALATQSVPAQSSSIVAAAPKPAAVKSPLSATPVVALAVPQECACLKRALDSFTEPERKRPKLSAGPAAWDAEYTRLLEWLDVHLKDSRYYSKVGAQGVKCTNERLAEVTSWWLQVLKPAGV